MRVVVYRQKENSHRREYLRLAWQTFMWVDTEDYDTWDVATKDATPMSQMEAAIFIDTRPRDGYDYEIEEFND